MKTSPIWAAALITGSLAWFAPTASIAESTSPGPAKPVITSPQAGSMIMESAPRIRINTSGLYNISSVTVRANGKLIGSAKPTSFFGEWSYAGGAHLSVMKGQNGMAIVDYHPSDTDPMFTMDGKMTKPNVFSGTFDQWAPSGQRSGKCNITFSLSKTGQLRAVMNGDAPLGKRTLNAGKGSGPEFSCIWKRPAAGQQTLRATVTYQDWEGKTYRAHTDPVVVTVKSSPDIAIKEAKGKGLVDGKGLKNLGNVKVGKRSKARTYVIQNQGTAPLHNLKIVRKGTDKSEFTASQPRKTKLLPGKSTTFKVSFKPRGKGLQKTVIQIHSNDPDENPFDVRVIGRGR